MKTFKKVFAVLFSVMLIFMTSIAPVLASNNLSEGNYKVTITSVETKAPLPSVKKALQKAFGDYALVKIDSEGNGTVTMQNQHMNISNSDANILTIKDVNVECTKDENFSNPKTKETETVNCPDIFNYELNLDDENQQVLTVTADYLNAFLGGGKDFETDLTVTLDIDNAQKVDDSTSFTPVSQSDTETTEVATTQNTTSSSTMSTSTIIKIACAAVFIIIIVVIIIVVKKKKDDKIYEEYLAKKAAERDNNND